MLILALFVAAAYASVTALAVHDQRQLEAMSYADLMEAIEKYGDQDERYVQERERRWIEIAHHKNEWVN